MTFRFASLLIFLSSSLSLSAQCGGTWKVLHYTETTGYDHNTRSQSLAMFESWENADGFEVTTDDSGNEFNSLSNLQQYAVVVFSNTSGDNGLNATQRANFESYIAAGGSYLGMHAASDTYRHSTANGGSTGEWDWYAETVAGATVQQNPNHTSQNKSGTMTHEAAGHPTLGNVPDPWNKTEEYYYWENGYLSNQFTELLRVGSTGGNSYDAPRMMAHCRNLPGGGRAFYTALGHASSNYSSNQNFRNLIHDALLWVAEPNTGSGGGITVSISTESRIDCFGETGALRAEVSGGTPPFVYSWSSGSTDSIATGLSAGNWSVTVTDDEGCTGSDQTTLTQPDPLELTPKFTPNTDSTGNPNGTAKVTVAGGTSPYTYSWTGPGGFTASQRSIIGLEAGTYELLVMDARGCEVAESVVVTNETATSLDEDAFLEDFRIQPNPSSGACLVTISLKNPQSFRLELLDTNGRHIWQSSELHASTELYEVSPPSWPAGLYVLRVRLANGREASRMLVRE